MIENQRLGELFSRFRSRKVLAVGDFFLDNYLFIGPALAEVSLETGLTAHQIISVRSSPGAAGTVAANLKAIGAGTVLALTCIGDDGHGFDLKRGLESINADISLILTSSEIATPTYTKPMLLQQDGPALEMERQDIKNRNSLPEKLEQEIIDRLRSIVGEVDVIVVSDQVQERNCGVITDSVREELVKLAKSRLVVVDSRTRIGEFGGSAVIKPNKAEAAHAVGIDIVPDGMEGALEIGKKLTEGLSAPFFITLGADGILAFGDGDVVHAPIPPVDGEIDIVGAGDSCLSAIACTIAAGGSLSEAAEVANLAAAVTIRKLGETGTASPEEILALKSRLD